MTKIHRIRRRAWRRLLGRRRAPRVPESGRGRFVAQPLQSAQQAIHAFERRQVARIGCQPGLQLGVLRFVHAIAAARHPGGRLDVERILSGGEFIEIGRARGRPVAYLVDGERMAGCPMSTDEEMPHIE